MAAETQAAFGKRERANPLGDDEDQSEQKKRRCEDDDGATQAAMAATVQEDDASSQVDAGCKSFAGDAEASEESVMQKLRRSRPFQEGDASSQVDHAGDDASSQVDHAGDDASREVDPAKIAAFLQECGMTQSAGVQEASSSATGSLL